MFQPTQAASILTVNLLIIHELPDEVPAGAKDLIIDNESDPKPFCIVNVFGAHSVRIVRFNAFYRPYGDSKSREKYKILGSNPVEPTT